LQTEPGGARERSLRLSVLSHIRGITVRAKVVSRDSTALAMEPVNDHFDSLFASTHVDLRYAPTLTIKDRIHLCREVDNARFKII
jgi:hypothetical protein